MYKLLKYISIFVLAIGFKGAFAMNELEVSHNEEDAEIARLEKEIKGLENDIQYIDNEIHYVNATIDYNNAHARYFKALKRGENSEKPEKPKNTNKGDMKINISVANALDAFTHSSRGHIRTPSQAGYSKKTDLARYTRKKFNIIGINEIVDTTRGYTPIHAIFNGNLAVQDGKNSFIPRSPRSLRDLNTNNLLKRSLYALWMWGAVLNKKDKDGNTALHYAGSRLQPKSVKFLCKMNPEGVNAQNNEGTSPHHYMYQQNKDLLSSKLANLRLLKCESAFLRFRSNPAIENIFGESVESYMQFTQEQKDKEVTLLDRLLGRRTEEAPLFQHHKDCEIDALEKEFELVTK